MNPEAEFHALLNLFATNSRIQLSQFTLKVYDQTIQPYGYEAAVKALHALLAETKSWVMPTPAQIVSKIMPKLSPIHEANEICGRVFEAVNRFGYTQPEDAKKHIGEIGWKIMGRYGGWVQFCTDCGVELDPNTTRAQIRDQAIALLEDQKIKKETFIQLESPENAGMIESAMKFIVSGKEMPK